MSRSLSVASPLRCMLVWLGLGGAAVLVGGLLVGELGAAGAALADGSWRTRPFEELLTWLAAAATALALTWLWAVAGLVALAAARGRRSTSVRGCPDLVRRLVLSACGVAASGGMIGALAAPALAGALPAPVPVSGDSLADGGSGSSSAPDLDGLPMPDRMPDRMPDGGSDLRRSGPPAPDPAGSASRLVVAPGDCLWDLAAAGLAEDLDRTPSAAQVERRWRAVHRLNAEVIGADPDLIHPGQRLRMPGTDHADRTPE